MRPTLRAAAAAANSPDKRTSFCGTSTDRRRFISCFSASGRCVFFREQNSGSNVHVLIPRYRINPGVPDGSDCTKHRRTCRWSCVDTCDFRSVRARLGLELRAPRPLVARRTITQVKMLKSGVNKNDWRCFPARLRSKAK